MSWAADGQDGNGLRLEQFGPIFFAFMASVLETLVMVYLLFENSLHISVLVFSKHFVYEKDMQC